MVRDLREIRNRERVFEDRRHAGAVLAGMLPGKRPAGSRILAIPAGGLAVAAAVDEVDCANARAALTGPRFLVPAVPVYPEAPMPSPLPPLALALLLAGCGSSATAVKNLTWKPPPQSSACTDAAPCENVKRWFAFETRSAGDFAACLPVPQKGTEETCARGAEASARTHQQHLEFFSGLCGESVGVPTGVVFPYFGVPENDKVITCGGKGGIPAFPCRVWEWTWATTTKGAAFLVFFVQPADGPPGAWVLNSCSYCDAGSSCRELPFRR